MGEEEVALQPHLGEEEVPGSPHTWFPLATEQLRLRGVTEVSLYHPQPGWVHPPLLLTPPHQV